MCSEPVPNHRTAARELPDTHEHLQPQVMPYAQMFSAGLMGADEGGIIFALIQLFALMLLVLVCWAVVGSLTAAALRPRGGWFAVVAAVLVASALFGVYHFAHSPPFNQLPMVLLLMVIGMLTSLFFFASGDVYGTIVFHNFLGVFGVLQALAITGNLAAFEQPLLPLLAMAAVSLLTLVLAHARWLRSGAMPHPS